MDIDEQLKKFRMPTSGETAKHQALDILKHLSTQKLKQFGWALERDAYDQTKYYLVPF